MLLINTRCAAKVEITSATLGQKFTHDHLGAIIWKGF